MKTSKKFMITGILLLLVLLCASVNFCYEGGKSSKITVNSSADLEGASLGGVTAKMPDNSALIFFDNYLGVKLRSYKSYGTVDTALAALRNNQVNAIWTADVTARYLTACNSDIREIQVSQETDRMEFGMALRPESTALLTGINNILSNMKQDGRLKILTDKYIDTDNYEECFYISDMVVSERQYKVSTGKTIYVGVTGAVPPIDSVNTQSKPYGFSVALMDEIAQELGVKVEFLVLDNETVFTELLGGRVDIVFCYGTSANHTTEVLNYKMTDGYYSMDRYSILVNK